MGLAYAEPKSANILFAQEATRRWSGSGIAATTTVWAATTPELAGRGGLVLEDCGVGRPVGPDTHPWSGYDDSVADPDSARRLWDISTGLIDELTGSTGTGHGAATVA